MAALVPPPNGSHVPLPEAPLAGQPATLMDITNARDYCDRLLAAKSESLVQVPSNQ
jgi:hypothetical protein